MNTINTVNPINTINPINPINPINTVNTVNILGDRNNFVSKNAISRFKNDIKTINYCEIEDAKYLKEGFKFKFIDKFTLGTDNNIVNIISEEENKKNLSLMEAREKLKNLLNNTNYKRSTAAKEKIKSLKRSVPKKIFESYVKLIKNYNLSNVPAPDDVINDVNKYRLQISNIMGKKEQLSNDATMSNYIRKYFNELGKFLNIEPLVPSNNMQFSSNQAPPEIIEEINV